MKLLAWAQSDVGRRREHNQDSFLVSSRAGLFVVADGMGGHQAGDRASRLAVEVIERELGPTLRDGRLEPPPTQDPTSTLPSLPAAGLCSCTRRLSLLAPGEDCAAGRLLRQATQRAGLEIYEQARENPDLRGMGTTLTGLLFHHRRACVFHVGDSRAYRYREPAIEQLTEDHTWIQEQLRAGFVSQAEARTSRFRHIITRSVGFEREVQVDLAGYEVSAGDCFLLCSDGLSNHVPEDEMVRVLRSTYYLQVPGLLVELANDRGGDDNITVILIYVANERGQMPAKEGDDGRVGRSGQQDGSRFRDWRP